MMQRGLDTVTSNWGTSRLSPISRSRLHRRYIEDSVLPLRASVKVLCRFLLTLRERHLLSIPHLPILDIP